MLKNIALIASAVSALTAVTTSLRAMGKSRENLRHETESGLKPSCRTGNCKTMPTFTKHSSLVIHLIVTLIWSALAVIFALPFFIHKWEAGSGNGLFLWTLPFLILAAILCFIWWNVLHPGN